MLSLHMLLMQACCVLCNLMSIIYTHLNNKDLEDDGTCDVVKIY